MAVDPRRTISSTLFYGFLWAGSAVSFCFVALRFAIRWKLFRQLFWDDACVGFAMIALLAQSIAWTVNGEGLFIAYDIAAGKLTITPERIQKMLEAVKMQLGALILFFTALWAIKVGFLLFFRRLGTRVQGYKIWFWWITLALVLITYVVSIALLPYRCMTATVDYMFSHGCATKSAVDYYYTVFYINCAFDIFTDLLLVSIPILYLWNIQIPLKQKVALIGLFSLTLCVMAVAVIRVAVNGKQNGYQQDTAWVAFWAIIEITIAIVVASLGSFRQLFVKSGGGRGSTSDASSGKMVASMRERFAKVSTPWRRGHHKTASHAALMREDTSYTPDIEGYAPETKSIEVQVRRTDVPLKRASQAHIAHYSAAPTERRYMVVHPGDSIEHGTSVPREGFI